MARLILESGGERRELRIAGPITIGRASSATVHIDDKTLSREHTQVSSEQGRFIVKDLESKNGTYLNGALIRQAEPLKHGDRIKVGPATFVILFDPGDAPPPAAAPRPATARAVAPAAAPARPKLNLREVVSGVHPAVKFVHTLFLIGVVVVGAFVSKFIFAILLKQIAP